MRRVVAVLPNLAGGGAERVTLNLLNGLDRTRFSPHLLLLDRSGPLVDLVQPDLGVVSLDRPRLRQALAALPVALRRLQPDVIFSSLGYVNIALAALKPVLPGRLVLREANLPSLSLQRAPWPRLTHLAYRLLYPAADRVLASSARMAAELAAMGVRPHRLSVLRNPVQVAAIRAQAAPPRRHPGNGLRLVAAGRLTPQKGFDRLVQMLSGVSDLHLTILGVGPQRSELAALAAAHGVALDLPGFVPDAPAWFAGADILALPSRFEGMPNVALEALACGTPVLATPEAGGIAEVAAAAAPGAVTIRAAGAEFTAAIRSHAPRNGASLRASLLPPEYDGGNVARQFETIMNDVVQGE